MSDEIRTRTVTPEYEEGFDRAFGLDRPTRKPGRTTYVFRDGKLVEVGGDWQETPRPPVFGDSHYDGLRASDGTDLSSRTKHREYMKANGLALADDYKETWANAAKNRAAPTSRDPERREQIGRALYEAEKRGRR